MASSDSIPSPTTGDIGRGGSVQCGSSILDSCPNCAADLVAGATECPSCSALFGPDHGWQAKPSKSYARVTTRTALVLWLLSWLLPAGRVGERLVWGWELALQSFNPLLLVLQPLAFFAAFTNLVFIVQASRLARHMRASAAAISVCLLVNLVALLQGASAKSITPLFAHVNSLAPWVWVTSFLFLLSAALKNEAS